MWGFRWRHFIIACLYDFATWDADDVARHYDDDISMGDANNRHFARTTISNAHTERIALSM